MNITWINGPSILYKIEQFIPLAIDNTMFGLFDRFFRWVYPNESLGGLTGGDIEDPEEETKYEYDEEYDRLYEEHI